MFVRWSTVLHSEDLLSPWGSLSFAIHLPLRLAALNGSNFPLVLLHVLVKTQKFVYGIKFVLDKSPQILIVFVLPQNQAGQKPRIHAAFAPLATLG
jgi:hypothetical protein